MGPDIFFPAHGQSKRKGEAVCAACPVTAACGAYADLNNEESGIWGGKLRNRNYVPPANDQEVNLIPRTFSASALGVYEECPARYKAENIDRVPSPGNKHASIGTACHDAIEHWVADGHYTDAHPDEWSVMKALYDEAYWRMFSDSATYDDGAKMLKKWLKRQVWTGRTVLSTEQKEHFTIKTTKGEFQFTYIMDRLDRLANGEIEVIDYKSLSMPVKPEDLKHKIQARVYALAAQLRFPEAERIWVTFDMLRHDPVGIVFTKADNRDTWNYLKTLTQRVVDDDEAREILGSGCRFCVRRSECELLNKHALGGGILGITDPVEASTRLYTARAAVKALEAQVGDLEKIVLDYMRDNDLTELEVPGLDVSVGISGRRNMDPSRLATVVPPEIMARYSKINVGSVDEMLEKEDFTSEEKSVIRQMFTTTYGDPTLRITPQKGLI